jgi:hypothetical protein
MPTGSHERDFRLEPERRILEHFVPGQNPPERAGDMFSLTETIRFFRHFPVLAWCVSCYSNAQRCHP